MRRWAGPVRWWHVAAVWALIYLPVFPRHHLLPSVSQKYVLDANIALRRFDEGRLATDRYTPGPPQANGITAARWVVAPLGWNGGPTSLAQRAR